MRCSSAQADGEADLRTHRIRRAAGALPRWQQLLRLTEALVSGLNHAHALRVKSQQPATLIGLAPAGSGRTRAGRGQPRRARHGAAPGVGRLDPGAASIIADDPVQAADAADLVYVHGASAGFRRVRRARQVIYL